MSLIETVFSSNLVQLAATFATGAGLYLLCRYNKKIFILMAYILALGIFFGFLFNVGEVYSYSSYYKRVFFIFGDQITTIFILFFCYAILVKKNFLALLLSTAMFLSGGKVSFVLLLLMIFVIFLVNKKNNHVVNNSFLKYITLGLVVYAGMLSWSGIAENLGFSEVVRKGIVDLVATERTKGSPGVDVAGGSKSMSKFDTVKKGGKACRNVAHCFDTQIKAPFFQRCYSSLAGLWMTTEGGYRGPHYPSSSEKFASLMIQENPWEMNAKYGLDFNDWKEMGAPQNPYLRFGSGYGVWYLGVLLTFVGLIVLIGVVNLAQGEKLPSAVFTIFFIVNGLLNQTQSWLTSGSLVLIALGFCFCHIVVVWLMKRAFFFDVSM